MYLKSIEVHGFKSFANKINFQFHNGITGIVGPNGSGKSNVADAVRWVLGEQRIKQLRGSSMQDVIFSGTQTRRAVGYAYVAITLDNSDHQLAIDYDEVTVARRVYRSGESEYIINGHVCRLRDVSELFYDTGIGKEGYSIIGQGQIDKILSGKPEERRELFDEAAGIVKFKRRKRESLLKLEQEKQNLLRVKDILSELEKQVKPLEKQSEVAKVYLKKKQELKTLDVNMFLLEHNRIEQQLELTTENLKIAMADLSDKKNTYENIKKEYDKIQYTIESLENSIEEARKVLSDSSIMGGKLEGEKNVLKEQIKSAKSNEAHLNTRLEAVQKEINETTLEKDKVFIEKEETNGNLAELEKNRDLAKEKLLEVQSEIKEMNMAMETFKNTIICTLNDRATIRSSLGSFDTMLEQIHLQKASLVSKLVSAKTEDQEQDLQIRALEEEFEKVNESIKVLHGSQHTHEKELEEIKEMLREQDETLRSTQTWYHQEKTKLETVTNLAERYEGYGGSVKRVMEQKEREPELIGVVADLIKVNEKYEVAMETALGGNIQNIVTEDESVAKKMIAYLKEKKGGRATFLPLTSIRNPQVFKREEVLKEQGVLGIASTLVETEEKYADVAKAMLGRIVVVDHIDHAIAIGKKYHHEIRMVTLEGELLVPGGAISGGAFKNNSNLLGRRREIEALEKKVEVFQKKIDSLQSSISEIKEKRSSVRIDLEQVKATLQQEFIHQNTARLNVISAKEKKEEVSSSAVILQREIGELEEKQEQISQEKEMVFSSLTKSEELEKEMENKIILAQQELEEKRNEESAQNTIYGEHELAVEKMLQSLGFVQQNVDRIEQVMARYAVEHQEIIDAISQIIVSVKEKEQQVILIENTINASSETQSREELKLQKEVALKEELGERQKNFFQNREEVSSQLSLLDKDVYRLQMQSERQKEAIQSQINYMWNEYEITLRDAATLRNPDMLDLSLMKREISGIKEEIKKLGNVNVNAIEEYKELMERYLFLQVQYEDLVTAEKTLTGIISELDSSMRKQFQEKFQEISVEFNKVFGELFGGGKGTLELMEDEDLLEAGVRIIAQPPGKKLQNMMQLSGGEKALTAISLLFAIQNLKPSPFCLLDEIEAALDESNVARFAKYLNKLTKHTQFIVITHRRGTMEKADRLYGITMQEKGVSTLVSVNLLEEGVTV